MKIYIDKIPGSGLKLAESYEPATLDLDRADIKITDPIDISGKIIKGINNVSVSLRINLTMHINCSRCLEEFLSSFSKEVNLNILIEGRNVIDITDNLREEIILSYPLKPLCRSDCQGLCPNCGQNLNKARCNC